MTVHYSECVPFDGSPPASPGECNVTFIPTTASTYALYFPVQLSDMVPGKAYRWEIGYGYLEPPNFDEFNESFSDICVSSGTFMPKLPSIHPDMSLHLQSYKILFELLSAERIIFTNANLPRIQGRTPPPPQGFDPLPTKRVPL